MTRLLGRGQHDHSRGATPGDEIPHALGKLQACLAIARSEVVGELVADDHFERPGIGSRDLAATGREQLLVALVHLGLQTGEDLVGLRHAHTHVCLRNRAPGRELHELAVEQPQPAGRVERRGGHELAERHRLARSRFAAEKQIALRKSDGHYRAVLVDADRNRIPKRQLRGVEVRPGERLVFRQRVPHHQREVCDRGVAGVAQDPDLAQSHARGECLGVVCEVVGVHARRQKHRRNVSARRRTHSADVRKRALLRRQSRSATTAHETAAHPGPVQHPLKEAPHRTHRP